MNNKMKEKEISKSILRNVILACVLEPIPEKLGCTTRKNDFQETSKLEYFITGGVNIGWDFYDLAQRIVENSYKQPKVIFDIAYNAQKNSFNNRNGGKINFGIIELLVPIITSQLVYKKGPIETLDLATKILKNTSVEDVKWHLEFRKIAKEKAKLFPKTVYYDVPNLYEYFSISKNEIEDLVHSEFINKFKLSKEAYNIILKNIDNHNLLDCTIIAYNELLQKCGNYPGLTADYICVAIYLFLTFNPNKIII